MLTGQDSPMEEVMSFKPGAEDFVAKPYHPQVLLAHIEAVLKRCSGVKTQPHDKISYKGMVLPLVCLVGVFNPFFDKVPVQVFGVIVNAGTLSMITLMMKGVFTVFASYLLIATTTIEKLCYAFRMLHIPKIMITQIMLTYRYVTVLLEEVNRITQAYSLRAPKHKGIHFKVWGSLTGQLFMTTAFEDIAFAPRNYGLPEEEVARRVDKALELTGIYTDG